MNVSIFSNLVSDPPGFEVIRARSVSTCVLAVGWVFCFRIWFLFDDLCCVFEFLVLLLVDGFESFWLLRILMGSDHRFSIV